MTTQEQNDAPLSDTELLKALASWFFEEEGGRLEWAGEQGNNVLEMLNPKEAEALVAFRKKHGLTNAKFT